MEPILVVFDPGLNKWSTLAGDDARTVARLILVAEDREYLRRHPNCTIGQRALENTGPEDCMNKGFGAEALPRLHPVDSRHCILGVGPVIKELPGQNLYIRSANGKTWKLGADDEGNLVTEEVDENIPA